MADSYAKRQMFYYGVEDPSYNNNGPAGTYQSAQQMALLLEN